MSPISYKYLCHKSGQNIAITCGQAFQYIILDFLLSVHIFLIQFYTSSVYPSLVNSGIWSSGVATVTLWPPSKTSFVHTLVHFAPAGR